MSQQNRTMESNQHPSQILHVRENSDSELQNLFAVLNNPRQEPNSVNSWNSRKLPKSFFHQPRHSRDSSHDSTYSNAGIPVHPISHPGLAPNHGRSQSLPTQMPLQLSAAPPQVHHNKQNSVDFAEDMANLHLPPSQPNTWDPKSGQQRYFANSQEQLQWIKQTNHGASTPQGTLSPAHSHPSSPSGSVHNLSAPLPLGWEQGVTPEGEIYFINHHERTTSWFDPRLPKHIQRPGPLKLGNGHGQGMTSRAPGLPVSMQQTLGSQSLLQNLAQISQGQSSIPATSISMALSIQGPRLASHLAEPQNIQIELERLKQEKDRLQREQEEIAKREMLLKEMMSMPKPTPNSDSQSTVNSQATIQSVSTTGVDPFLGQGSNNMESHARQNSGDSGLGGMGTNYSLPRTPDGFLSNVDEMDIQECGPKQMLKPLSSDFNMNDLQQGVCMDMGQLGDADQSGMESDDLVPSLQEDISSLSSDLLNDVDVGKMDNLLWL